MKVLIRHFGKVSKGRTQFSNEKLWFQQLALLEGKDFELTIKERTKKPSLDQYGFYRGAILGSCWESEDFKSFDSPDAIHKEYFAPLFLSYTKLITVGDKQKEQEFIQSLADLTREEVSTFIERVIAHCATEHGITILSPEEYQIKNYLF